MVPPAEPSFRDGSPSTLRDGPSFRDVSVESAPYAVRVMRRFVEVCRGRRRPVVHLQHNPDPDAIGSGIGLQYLLRRLFGVEAVLAHTGQVGRAENRAMLRWLGIHLIPSYKVDYAQHDLVLVVDTHPGSGTCRLPDGVRPDVVVDHHPRGEAETNGAASAVPLSFQDSTFGSTSTMVGYLLLENGVPVAQRVATALLYGIKTDTQDLARTPSPIDAEVYHLLDRVADRRIVGRIERARLPQDYFLVLEKGLRRGQVTDFAVTTHLGNVAHADSVAEIADILFRLEGMKWALASGYAADEGVLCLSLRAVQAEGIDAGAVAREISDGQGGGHETFAAAQIPVAAGTNADALYEEVRQRFLQAIRAKKTLTRPLTLPPDEGTA